MVRIHTAVPVFLTAAALLVSTPACTSSSSSGGGAAAGAASGTGTGTGGGASVPAQPPQGVWLGGDLHQHTTYSGDAVQLGDGVAMSIELAARAGLDFTALTDHRTFDSVTDPARTGHPSVIALGGMEWNGDGHANVIGIQTPNSFPVSMGGQLGNNQTAQLVIDEIHNQGGVFIVNHPAYPGDLWVWEANGYDGIEVWNSFWTLRATNAPDGAFVRRAAQGGGLTGAPLLEQACDQWRSGGANRQALAWWEMQLAQGKKIAATGGGDRHYLTLPGTPTTFVFASGRSEAAILEGIRLHRTCVSRGPNAPIAEIHADVDGDGVFETMMGGSVPLGRQISFKVHVMRADGGRVDVIKDGAVLQRFPVTSQDFEVTFSDTAGSKGFYRLDVHEPIDLSTSEARTLRTLVLYTGDQWARTMTTGIVGSILSFASSWVGQIQRVIDAGGPPLLWLVFYGDKMGCRISPAPSRYPCLEFPDNVSRILNVDPLDKDFARGAITSAIYAE